MMWRSMEGIWCVIAIILMSTYIHHVKADGCEDFGEIENMFIDISACGYSFPYNIDKETCLEMCLNDENCLAVNYFFFIPGCLMMNCFNISELKPLNNTCTFLKCSIMEDEEESEDSSDITLISPACFANGTIAFENPNTILYTDVMAVQYEGVSSAFNCDCTWSGNWVLITGCNTNLDVNVFFSNRSNHDGTIFGGERSTTRSYILQCTVPDSVNRTIANGLTMGIDLTTVDAVTPMFTVTTALRSVNATGPLEITAVVGETLYWTIDIPAEYNGKPTCTAYSGTSTSGSPDALLVSEGCISETSVVLGHFENEITPYAGTKRYWTTIAAFKFYNSFDVYIMCTVTVCPDSSSSCDINCSRRRKRTAIDFASAEKGMEYKTSSLLHIIDLDSGATPATLGKCLLLAASMIVLFVDN